MLRQAAVLGRKIRVPAVANAMFLDEDDVVDMLRAGVQAQLLSLDRGAFQFRHVLTLDPVMQAMPPAARQRHARQGLEALLRCEDAGDLATLRVAAQLVRIVGDGVLASRAVDERGCDRSGAAAYLHGRGCGS